MTDDDALFPVPIEPTIDDVARDLCATLAAHVGERTGWTPTVSVVWIRDMRLLLQRGPTGMQPRPLDPAEVRAVIDLTFRHETWWSDTLETPGFLRKHYLRIGKAAAERERAAPKARDKADVLAIIDRLAAL